MNEAIKALQYCREGVSHFNLREEVMGWAKVPKSYKCPRCGMELLAKA